VTSLCQGMVVQRHYTIRDPYQRDTDRLQCSLFWLGQCVARDGPLAVYLLWRHLVIYIFEYRFGSNKPNRESLTFSRAMNPDSLVWISGMVHPET
jgi:hypothetical protein